MLLNNELTLIREVLIIHLLLFDEQDDKLIKINKFYLHVPTTKVSVGGQL